MGKKVLRKKPPAYLLRTFLKAADGNKDKAAAFLRGLDLGYAVTHGKNKTKFNPRTASRWSKEEIIKLWKGDNWDQVKDFCTLTGIKPKEVLAWAASRRLDKTDKTTVLIKAAYSRINSKLKMRAKVLNKKKIFIKIDPNLKQRNNEQDRKHDERIYQRVFKAVQGRRS